MPNVKEDASRRRRVLAEARAAMPRDRWAWRGLVVAALVAIALFAIGRRAGYGRLPFEVAIAFAPLAAFCAIHFATRGPPSLSAVWLEGEYTMAMGSLGVLVYGLHAVPTRSLPRILAAVAGATAPLVASWVRLGVGMGSDFSDPAWPYLAIAGVVPVATSCGVAAFAVFARSDAPPGG